MLLNEEPVVPVIYALGHCPGFRFAWEERAQYSIAEFARAGVRLVQAEVWMEQLWTSEKEFSIEPARKQVGKLLKGRLGRGRERRSESSMGSVRPPRAAWGSGAGGCGAEFWCKRWRW